MPENEVRHPTLIQSVSVFKRYCPAILAIVFLFGVTGYLLGADTNWDLLNYHFYNGYAFWHDRLTFDMAPAGPHTYFFPLLDGFYYGLVRSVPYPWMAGVILGLLNSSVFLILIALGKILLQGIKAPAWTPVLLAVLGVLTPAFGVGFASAMGDNLSAIPELAALYFVLRYWRRWGILERKSVLLLAAIGLLAGVSPGLKLTNISYTAALAFGFLLYPSTWKKRIALFFIYGTSEAIGFLSVCGWWFVKLWHQFGNPLFPQYSSIFHHSWVENIGKIEERFGTHSPIKILLTPFTMVIDPHSVAEYTGYSVLWALYAVLGLIVLVKLLLSRKSFSDNFMQIYFFFFICAGFVFWDALLGSSRYLIPIEVCLPIALCQLAINLGFSVRKVLPFIICVTVASTIIKGIPAHASWSDPQWDVELPKIANPTETTVLLYSPHSSGGASPTWSWLVPFFPQETMFAGVFDPHEKGLPTMPATENYYTDLKKRIALRGGQIYAIINGLDESAADAQRTTAIMKLAERSKTGCTILQFVIEHFSKKNVLISTPDGLCRMVSRKSLRYETTESFYQSEVEQAQKIFGMHGFRLESCTVQSASIGNLPLKYQWCRVRLAPNEKLP